MVFFSLISENCQLKQQKRSKNSIFTIYSLIKEIIEKADTGILDTEISIKLPENTNAFLATKFEGQEIQKVMGPKNGKKKALDNAIKRILFLKISN